MSNILAFTNKEKVKIKVTYIDNSFEIFESDSFGTSVDISDFTVFFNDDENEIIAYVLTTQIKKIEVIKDRLILEVTNIPFINKKEIEDEQKW